jgi:EAL domain-containing protein (putative c-di-GMP-specific phosphodiesterase class I)
LPKLSGNSWEIYFGGIPLGDSFRPFFRSARSPQALRIVIAVWLVVLRCQVGAAQQSPPASPSSDQVAKIGEALRESGLNPAQLKLEITESLAMSDAVRTETILWQLKALGIGLCIDDFGTGYSSLSYLRRFPVNTLKIDRSFISGMGTDSESGEIVRTIVTLAHNLGLDVIAEGVETIEQADLLKKFSCGFAQGFYFRNPLDPKAVEDLFESHGIQKV